MDPPLPGAQTVSCGNYRRRETSRLRCNDRVLVVVRLNQRAMKRHNGLLIGVFVHYELDVHLPHALVQGQNADILVRQGLDWTEPGCPTP